MVNFTHKDDPCSHCGTCFSYCLWDRFEREHPGVAGNPSLCLDCMACYNICARVHPSESFPPDELFAGAARHPLLAPYREAWSGSATKKAANAQDGGVTTVLLQAMFDRGMIDGAALVGRDGRWNPVATVARNANELAAGAGSKYTAAPGMTDLSDALSSCERLAVVTVPCQTTAVRNQMRRGPKYLPERLVAVLGLFCYETFRYEAVQALVEEDFAVPMEQVSRFDIKKNRLIFFRDGDAEPLGNAPLTDLKDHTWPVCHTCTDFTAELADVSLGAVGSKPGENTILIRTPLGRDVVEGAVAAGLLTLDPVRNLGLVERISENKRKRRAELTPEEVRFLTKQTLRGNYKKLMLKGQW